jgi:hypothetical protein
MVVIECDRCKKRIGESGSAEARETRKVRMMREEKILCTDCAEKLDRFISGADDLRANEAEGHDTGKEAGNG